MIITDDFAVRDEDISYINYKFKSRYVQKWERVKYLFIFERDVDNGCFSDFHQIHIVFKNGKTTVTEFEDFEECKKVLKKLLELF
jgi:predicted NAD-dependent protein-ADP-ribosyltransferase YbiA (DUF1768 family)